MRAAAAKADAARARAGIGRLYDSEPVAHAARKLRDGEAVLVLADYAKSSMRTHPMRLLDAVAQLPAGVVTLARLCGAPIVPFAVLPLGPDGVPLGMFPESTYTVTRFELEPGDLLILYSDGLVEARNAADEEFGFDRLTRLAPALREREPADAGRRLLDEVDRFLGEVRPQDDLSIVLIRRLG